MDIFDLRRTQLEGTTDELTSLRSVVVNIIDTCNRKCPFCVKSVYEGDTNMMNVSTVTKIKNDLLSINYSGRIGINGFGEPFLHNNLLDIINILSRVNASWLEIQTNGDFLDKEYVKQLEKAGCNTISISMYDCDKSDYFNEMFVDSKIQLVLRHHYDPSVNYNLKLVNRIEMFSEENYINLSKPCYYPFYKLFIDHTGTVLLCNNDVKKVTDMGNVNEKSIREIWLSESFTEYRRLLIDGNRNLTPCVKCNMDGEVFGSEYSHIYRKMI